MLSMVQLAAQGLANEQVPREIRPAGGKTTFVTVARIPTILSQEFIPKTCPCISGTHGGSKSEIRTLGYRPKASVGGGKSPERSFR